MLWGYFSSTGTGALMNSSKYQSNLEMKRNFSFQHDSAPKYTSKSKEEWLQLNKISFGKARGPDLNRIEYLWDDLKRAVHRGYPAKKGKCVYRNIYFFNIL